MNLLLIDNTLDEDSWGGKDFRNLISPDEKVSLFVRRAPENDLPDSFLDYDGIVLSGSRTSCFEDAPWVDALHEKLREAIGAKKPILGVCFGHQTLIRAISSKENLGKAETPEFGWVKVETNQKSPLFASLPDSFYSYGSHYEEVKVVPKGVKVIASSERCKVQAFQFEGKPIFGVQFHPEKTANSVPKTLKTLKEKKELHFFLHPREEKKLYDERVGRLLFQNFFRIIRGES